MNSLSIELNKNFLEGTSKIMIINNLLLDLKAKNGIVLIILTIKIWT